MFFFLLWFTKQELQLRSTAEPSRKRKRWGRGVCKNDKYRWRKHKHALEKETLFGKARKGYTARITGEQTKVSTFVFYVASKRWVDEHSPLEMGWAVTTTRSRTQLTEEQQKLLTEQFLIREECGKKADPQKVSQEMRRVGDEKRARIFSGKKYSFATAGGRILLKTGNKDSKNASNIEQRTWKWRWRAECGQGSCQRRNCFMSPDCRPFLLHLQFGSYKEIIYINSCYAKGHLWRCWLKRGWQTEKWSHL